MIYTTPGEITERILKFCREKIDPTTKPVFLKLVPVGECRLGDCFGEVVKFVDNTPYTISSSPKLKNPQYLGL